MEICQLLSRDLIVWKYSDFIEDSYFHLGNLSDELWAFILALLAFQAALFSRTRLAYSVYNVK